MVPAPTTITFLSDISTNMGKYGLLINILPVFAKFLRLFQNINSENSASRRKAFLMRHDTTNPVAGQTASFLFTVFYENPLYSFGQFTL